jgi:hypothetical protein
MGSSALDSGHPETNTHANPLRHIADESGSKVGILGDVISPHR